MLQRNSASINPHLRKNETQRGSLLSKQNEILYYLENDFPWLEYDEDYRGAFCGLQEIWKITSANRRSMGYQAIYKLEETVEKMKDHEKSHFRAQVNMAYFAV